MHDLEHRVVFNIYRYASRMACSKKKHKATDDKIFTQVYQFVCILTNYQFVCNIGTKKTRLVLKILFLYRLLKYSILTLFVLFFISFDRYFDSTDIGAPKAALR